MSAGALPRRVLMVGDISGAADFHVGDEAMLEANLLMLRRLLPDAEFTLVSRDPLASAARYACPAVPRLRLSGRLERRSEELSRLDHWMKAASEGAALPDALAALVQAELLVISGGGNLSSTWPEHILERLALARLARERGIPLLILGQTLGPNLLAEDAALLCELLCAARWVGVREASSYALALSLGVEPARLDYQLDDAIDLPGCPLADPWPATGDGPRLALTLHPVFAPDADNGWLDRLAGELQQLIDATAARLVFVPHVGSGGDGPDRGDRSVGEVLARRLRDPQTLRVLDVPSSAEAVWLAQQADVVLSSRYHPLVFALAQHVPCLGLATDRYTQVKLHGALAHAGREADLLMLHGNGWPDLVERLAVVCRRPRPSAAERQAEVVRLAELRGQRERRLLSCLANREAAAPSEELVRALARLVCEPLAAEPAESLEHWRDTAEEARHYAQSLELALDERGQEVEALNAALAKSQQRRQEAESYAASLEQARVLEGAGIEAMRASLEQAVRRAEAAEEQLRCLEQNSSDRA